MASPAVASLQWKDADGSPPSTVEGPAKAASSPSPQQPQQQPVASPEPVAPGPTAPGPTLLIQHSIRTGQQVYAKGGSLCVMGSVNSGAEVLADGDIYIYGALRGRAMAGRDGNSDSKVFASQFEAELVGIANAFAVCEENPAGVEECRPTMVWLEVEEDPKEDPGQAKLELRFKSFGAAL